MSTLIAFVEVPSPTADIALQVGETDSANKYDVSGWGQLHLTVLVELKIGPPVVIDKTNEETGKKEECGPLCHALRLQGSGQGTPGEQHVR